MTTSKYSIILLSVLLGFGINTDAATIKVLGLYNQGDSAMATTLGYAFDRVNSDSSVLSGHTVSGTTASTKASDTYAAVDAVCAALATGVDMIVDASSATVRSAVRKQAEVIGIPMVSIGDMPADVDSATYSNSVNFDSPTSVMTETIASVVSVENMTNIAFVYDSTFDYSELQRRILRNVPAQHMYLSMPSTNADIDTQLGYIKNNAIKYIFVLASNTNAGKYLGRANSYGLMTFKFYWFVMSKDAAVTCSACTSSSNFVTMTAKPDATGSTGYITFMGTKSGGFSASSIKVDAAFANDVTMLAAKGLASYLASNSWISPIVPNCGTFTTPNATIVAQAAGVITKLKALSATGTFGSFVFSSTANKEQMVVNLNSLAYSGGSLSSTTALGTWSSSTGLSSSSVTIVSGKRSYRISTLVEPPFLFKESDGTYKGYCFELIKHLAREMNFDYTIVESSDGKYGSLQTDGSWNGMVNDLIQDKADIIVAPFSVMAERESVIDYSVPFYDLVGITILMKKPVFQYQLFKFMTVLEDNVWICFLSAFFLCSFLLWLFDRLGPYSYQNNKSKYWDGTGMEPRIFDFKEGVWFCFTSMTPQGGGEAPMAISAKMIAAAWWVFGFIMIATYTANLAAFLTVSRLETPIESLDDLAEQFKTKYAPQADAATQTYFRRMADIEDRFYSLWKDMSMNNSLGVMDRAKLAVWDYPVSDKFTSMWTSMAESKFPASFAEAIARVKTPLDTEEDFAFIGDATQNKYAVLTNCDFWEVGEEFSRKPYALAVQEGQVALKNELSDTILSLRNQRILEDMKSYWWEYNMKQCPKVEDESEGISLRNIGGVFLLIFMGVGFALVALTWEFFWYKYRADKKKAENKTVVVRSHSPDDMQIKDVEKNSFEKDHGVRPRTQNNAFHM